MKATATFTPTKWDEKPYEQVSSSMKMTKASAEFAFKGEWDGHGLVEYLMFYEHFDEKDPHNSKATYVGLIRFKGQLNGKTGSLVLEDRGTFQGRTANSSLTVMSGSGTEGLKGIRGTGKYTASPQHCQCDLTYELG
jgi:hypothetical protein